MSSTVSEYKNSSIHQTIDSAGRAHSHPPPPPHLLSLKVLRNSRASFSSNPTIESSSHPSHHQLILPNSFGSIYLGECFTALISLQVDEQEEEDEEGGDHQPNTITSVLNPSLLVEIQSNPISSSSSSNVEIDDEHQPSANPQDDHHKKLLGSIQAQRLSSKPYPTPSFHDHDHDDDHDHDHDEKLEDHDEQKGLELVIDHQILRLGLHSLICTVSYQQILPPSQITHPDHPKTQLRSFRKLYKFHALNPFSIRTKLLRSSNDDPDDHHQDLDSLIIRYPAQDHGDRSKTTEGLNQEDRLLPFIHPNDQAQVDDDEEYLEIQIQNQSIKSIFDLNLKLDLISSSKQEERLQASNEKIELLPTSSPTHQIDSTPAITDRSKKLLLQPEDRHQFLFKIHLPPKNLTHSHPSSQDPTHPNRLYRHFRLELNWFSFMAEPARLIKTIKFFLPPPGPPLHLASSSKTADRQDGLLLTSSPSPSQPSIHYFHQHLHPFGSSKPARIDNRFFSLQFIDSNPPDPSSLSILPPPPSTGKLSIKFRISIRSYLLNPPALSSDDLDDHHHHHHHHHQYRENRSKRGLWVDRLRWILATGLKTIKLVNKADDPQAKDPASRRGSSRRSKLMILNSLPLRPRVETEDSKEFELELYQGSEADRSSNLRSLEEEEEEEEDAEEEEDHDRHRSVAWSLGRQPGLLASLLELSDQLGHLSTGDQDLDRLFNLSRLTTYSSGSQLSRR